MLVECNCGAKVQISGTYQSFNQAWIGDSESRCREMGAIKARGETVPSGFECTTLERHIEVAFRRARAR